MRRWSGRPPFQLILQIQSTKRGQRHTQVAEMPPSSVSQYERKRCLVRSSSFDADTVLSGDVGRVHTPRFPLTTACDSTLSAVACLCTDYTHSGPRAAMCATDATRPIFSGHSLEGIVPGYKQAQKAALSCAGCGKKATDVPKPMAACGGCRGACFAISLRPPIADTNFSQSSKILRTTTSHAAS